MARLVCTPKSLPAARLAAAVRRAIAINPANAVQQRAVARTPIGRRGGPRRLAVVIGRRWPAAGVRLSVQFLDNPPADLRTCILRAYFDRTQGWTAAEVQRQVLTPLKDKSIMGGSITKDGKPIVGGKDINPTGAAFAASIYPKRIAAPRPRR